MSVKHKTEFQPRIETLSEIAERGGRFEYEALCDGYEARRTETDASAVKAAAAVSAKALVIAALIVVAVASIPHALNAWRHHAMAQSPLWRDVLEDERAAAEAARQARAAEDAGRAAEAAETLRTVLAGVGILLLLAYGRRRIKRWKAIPPRRREGRMPPSSGPPRPPPAS